MHLLIINIILNILFSILATVQYLYSIRQLLLILCHVNVFIGNLILTINLNSHAAWMIDHKYIHYI